MNRLLSMKRLSILFVALFAIGVAGVIGYQVLVTEPGEECEAGGRWYDPDTGICAQPISIAEITKRPIGQTREEASAEKNRELVGIEDAINAQKRAAAAETNRQREALNN